MTSLPKGLVTLEQAAEHYQVTPRTVRRWISAGRVKAYRLGPQGIRVDLATSEVSVLREIPSATAR
jgi:excisionase family DNA binding protein